jgi:predicted TIM-barrel fold metal-dependent hydrolase
VTASRHIDIHAHYVPPGYRAALLDSGHAQPDGFPHIPDWSADEHVAAMDRLGIQTSLLSISSPGVHLAQAAATPDLAREVNEEGQRAVVDCPGRFGLFASLPLPDVDATMAEIAYCCDHLGVVGFTLLTNIGGTYLGDRSFQPVFRELDRRGARVFIHPTSPACWEHTSLGRPRPMLEFFFDTTRTIVDLVLNGTVATHPGVEFIVPHAGATLPMVADRISVFSSLLDVDAAVDVLRDLARLHFDLAGFPIPRQLNALLTLTTFDHLHYGTDYPFTPEFAASAALERLAEAGDPSGSVLMALRANTERLFPALTL